MQCYKTYVVRYGNHWLQTDDHRTDPKWVTDLAVASRHTQEWCEKYAADKLKLRESVEVVPLADAEEMKRRESAEAVKSRWMHKFEEAVRYTYFGYTSDGLWTNAHMYHGMNLTVQDAVDRFGGPGGPKVKRRTPATVSVENN